MPDKFRSIKAFKEFEQRSRGADSVEGGVAWRTSFGLDEQPVSPIRVLAAVKKHPKGVQRSELAGELAAPLPAVEQALLYLLQQDLVQLEPGPTPNDDLIFPDSGP